MTEILTCALLLSGTFFVFTAGVGLLRFPDAYCRMHAATKAVTLGMIGLLAAVAMHYQETGVTLRALAAVVFYFCTSPVGAHLMSRAAYRVGIPIYWGGGRTGGFDEYAAEAERQKAEGGDL